MKIIAIIGENIEQSTKVRKEAIRGGTYWIGGSMNPELHQDSKYLTLIKKKMGPAIVDEYMTVASYDGDSVLDAVDRAQENGYEIITATKFLIGNTIAPGWKEPKSKVIPEPTIRTRFGDISLSTIESILEKNFNEAYSEGK